MVESLVKRMGGWKKGRDGCKKGRGGEWKGCKNGGGQDLVSPVMFDKIFVKFRIICSLKTWNRSLDVNTDGW